MSANEHIMWYDKPITARELLASIPTDPATATVFARFQDELKRALSGDTGERENVRNLQNYRAAKAQEGSK